ncbi:hypothetical protein CDV31_010333 [Fusarium ambrosium]|uniref:Uncharacterized protein n=1 Tax=Fusarium ambrosium TaxID=131363 RepID=A0A428TP75_9HYPO|nr:hypothetical protein CDV31_010333 [Fusarium ambrosium]
MPLSTTYNSIKFKMSSRPYYRIELNKQVNNLPIIKRQKQCLFLWEDLPSSSFGSYHHDQNGFRNDKNAN